MAAQVQQASGAEQNSLELTILMPCLNETETIGTCIAKAKAFMNKHAINGEVLIADNGSTDGSQSVAEQLGARVIHVPARGYGSALRAGIEAARGTYVIMGDADDSYDFSNLAPFLDKLRAGYDLVMGNRFLGGIAPKAMPFLHKYLGNPVLTGLGRLFFNSPVGDFHCGLRGIKRSAIARLDLLTTGMEFASEMVVRSSLADLKIIEVPTALAQDGRSRSPHLRSWRDGWRHLRFLLMYSPRWLFLYPGLALIAFGVLTSALVMPGMLRIGWIALDVHTLVVSMGAIIVGTQVAIFYVLARQYAIQTGVLPRDARFQWFLNAVTLERTVTVGAFLAFFGLSGIVGAVAVWSGHSFGPLDYQEMMRLIVPSVAMTAVGVQIVMAGFLSAIFQLDSRVRYREVRPRPH